MTVTFDSEAGGSGPVRLENRPQLTRNTVHCKRGRVSKRFVPIATHADADRPELAMLIEEAAALDPGDWD